MDHHHTCGHGCADSCCLQMDGLSVTVDSGNCLLKDINLHIHCGQMVAVIGPNGAGKSTLFKTILGHQPYSGTLTFHRAGGQVARLQVGYVPQSPSFDPGDPLTVQDLLLSAISRWPVCLPTPRSLRMRAESCLARVDGIPLLSKRVGSLSGGELQRVLLAMALEPVPNLLILDEPLSGVDIQGAAALMEMLDQLRRDYDLSILLSTHDFDMLRSYADQVLLLNKSIVRAGGADDVLSSPEFRQVFQLGKGGVE